MKVGTMVMVFVMGMALTATQLATAGSESGTNTLYGENAGAGITTGTSNTFIGSTAGYSDTSGGWNTFLGQEAGYSNETANTNTFVGQRAGYSNETGEHNTFLGMESGFFNTARYNTFVGQRAGYSNTTGELNTFIGQISGNSNTTGSCNTFLGEQSGYSNSTGQGNLFLGYKSGYKETGSNKLYIDNSDTEHPLISGDFATDNIIIYGGFKAIANYSSSDGRWKKNIEPLESSLEKVLNLQGVSYEWKTTEYPDFGLMKGKQIGLVAQDVEKELPELVSEDREGYKAVSYTKLTAVLVEAVKELKALDDQQRERITKQQKLIEDQQNQFKEQQAEIEELRTMIKELKS